MGTSDRISLGGSVDLDLVLVYVRLLFERHVYALQ